MEILSQGQVGICRGWCLGGQQDRSTSRRNKFHIQTPIKVFPCCGKYLEVYNSVKSLGDFLEMFLPQKQSFKASNGF